jgi:hypothetical protein
VTTRDRSAPGNRVEAWPALPYAAWRDTYATLHMWTQIVGKVRLARSPRLNHWWQVPLYVTSTGLTTSPMPDGDRTFEMTFDFHEHRLNIVTSDRQTASVRLEPRSVADFYREVMARLRELGIDVSIWPVPVEVPDPVPFEDDEQHASYDAVYAERCWRALVQVDRLLKEFRSGFIGKASPVHFFWGAFDMAVTRFSGRLAPEHPGAPNIPLRVAREAYSHEVSSCGWWPGGGPYQAPVFYAYAYPEPARFREAPVRPEGVATYFAELGEFLLPYETVRTSADPDAEVMTFLETTYAAAAELGGWDRASLERQPKVGAGL